MDNPSLAGLIKGRFSLRACAVDELEKLDGARLEFVKELVNSPVMTNK